MFVVHKYRLATDFERTFVKCDGKVEKWLKVGEQNGGVFIWALVDIGHDGKGYLIHTKPTGGKEWAMPPNTDFVDTVQHSNGLVVHYFAHHFAEMDY